MNAISSGDRVNGGASFACEPSLTRFLPTGEGFRPTQPPKDVALRRLLRAPRSGALPAAAAVDRGAAAAVDGGAGRPGDNLPLA